MIGALSPFGPTYADRWRWFADRVANYPDGITIDGFARVYSMSYGPAYCYLDGATNAGLIQRKRNGRKFIYYPLTSGTDA